MTDPNLTVIITSPQGETVVLPRIEPLEGVWIADGKGGARWDDSIGHVKRGDRWDSFRRVWVQRAHVQLLRRR